jgi:hypothetical protein
MINLKYSQNVIKARLLLYNPASTGVWLTVKVKAFSGPVSPNSQTVTGLNYVGYWNFPNIFQTASLPITSKTVINSPLLSNQSLVPDRGPWRELTTWTFTNANNVMNPLGGGYVILEVPINNYGLLTYNDK